MPNNILKIAQPNTVIKKDGTYKLILKESIDCSIIIEENSLVNIVTLYENIKDIIINLKIIIKKGSILQFDNLDFNKGNKNINFEFILLGDNAVCKFNSAIISDDSKNNYNVKVINSVPKTIAKIYQKSVVKNFGESKLNITSKIEKEAYFSENTQESRVLLLDEASLGEASPILLIDNNEVIASHKASVSRVDKEQMYYLQTRGIEKKQAEVLLMNAFIDSVLSKTTISNEQKELILKEVTND